MCTSQNFTTCKLSPKRNKTYEFTRVPTICNTLLYNDSLKNNSLVKVNFLNNVYINNVTSNVYKKFCYWLWKYASYWEASIMWMQVNNASKTRQ